MLKQPDRNYKSNDDVITPLELANAIVPYFALQMKNGDKILEPCSGKGAFLNPLKFLCTPRCSVDYCEITEGRDFYDYFGKVSWTLTNPPWSMIGDQKEVTFQLASGGWSEWMNIRDSRYQTIRKTIKPKQKKTRKKIGFLEKSLQVSDNVVFLLTLNHATGLKARWRILDRYKFGLKETILVDTPPLPWPQSGFQVAVVHWQKGYEGDMKQTNWKGKIKYGQSLG